ncbi:hypothetical protein AMATHDRAFT_70 [Amanita thiersii Skay4041]|uniref:Ras-GEF domain-containing protein n=1 Tax=Amanita thiersii Skay4041 TaxID=703135 RepID=A0A2A9P1B6_9AGAR|nr:hypothetical protein AMATHDRAFT_70 [Amanita thiersii Skay4041]
MTASQPFLTLQPVPPLDLSLTDGTIAHSHSHNHNPTSPSSTTVSQFSSQLRPTNDSLSPSPSLRKSVSVDSFAQYGRESPVHSGPRPTRGNTSSALEPPRTLVYGISTSLKKEREQQLQGSRTRGASTISNKTAYESSLHHDSDVERSDTMGSPVERYRHNSLKPQDYSKPALRAGELSLPSRTPTLSTTSSMSSVVTNFTTNSPTLEEVPRLMSQSSLQAMPRRGTLPTVSDIGRARSGSLGVYNSSSTKRSVMVTNLESGPDPTVTLIIVGASGSGKSTIIRKGLKRFGLSDPSMCRTTSPIPGLPSITTYSRRTGRVGQLENVIDCPLRVIEADVPPSFAILTLKQRPILDSVPRVDGVVVCYDSANPISYIPVEGLLREYGAMRIPTLVLACKSDLGRQVDSAKAHALCRQYDVGLIEVSVETGKDRIGLAFEFLLQAVWRDRRDKRQGLDIRYRNPASPKLLKHSPLWDTSRSVTPTASSPVITVNAASSSSQNTQCVTTDQTSNSTVRSGVHTTMSDPITLGVTATRPPPTSADANQGSSVSEDKPTATTRIVPLEKKEEKEKNLKPVLYMTIEELLDKLLFLAVSGDDPAFTTHFLLIYRRFATPRSVLLAMQKRMRQLDNPSGDPMFACFAQMRICNLLETWIKGYSHDFAVRGTAGALFALIKSILSKTYLLHYGSELLPFLETLPNLRDDDAAWALKMEDIGPDSDSESFLDDEEIIKPPEKEASTTSILAPPLLPEKPQPVSRERKASIPLAKALKQVAGSMVNGHPFESSESSAKYQLKDVARLAHEVMHLDPEVVAQEITRIQAKLFLAIKPRHWLHLTFAGKNEFCEPITVLNSFANHLAEWVISIILSHDRPRNRAKQLERLIEIASKLRHLNNYSALRAFIAGIHGSIFPGDGTMEAFKAKNTEQYKTLQSWEVLFKPLRSHRAYRMALKNSKGGCIPALEVHIQDLIKTNEGNSDSHSDDSTKIHWGKFNLIGKLIISTSQYQTQCRNAPEYNFPDRGDIVSRLFNRQLMTEEVRLKANENDVESDSNLQMKRSRLPADYAENEDFNPLPLRNLPIPVPPQQVTPQPISLPPPVLPSTPPKSTSKPATPLTLPSQVALLQVSSSQIPNTEIHPVHKLIFW